jgi:hypothetical protein
LLWGKSKREADVDNAVTVRRATETELPEIWQLTHTEYVRQGYIKPQPGGMYLHYEHLDKIRETTQLVALVGKKIVGTVTHTTDGPSGLYPDVDYPEETQTLRGTGVKLACVWRIVTDFACRSSHRVSTALMRETARQLMAIGEPLLLCMVHPHHIHYYKKRMGFVAVAESQDTKALASAPSVLMVGGKGSYSRLIKE